MHYEGKVRRGTKALNSGGGAQGAKPPQAAPATKADSAASRTTDLDTGCDDLGGYRTALNEASRYNHDRRLSRRFAFIPERIQASGFTTMTGRLTPTKKGMRASPTCIGTTHPAGLLTTEQSTGQVWTHL
jgi:hypothetical protein